MPVPPAPGEMTNLRSQIETVTNLREALPLIETYLIEHFGDAFAGLTSSVSGVKDNDLSRELITKIEDILDQTGALTGNAAMSDAFLEFSITRSA